MESWFAAPDGPYQHLSRRIGERGGFRGKTVLDVGCGPGRFLAHCRDEGAVVSGLDLSPVAVELARKRFGLEVLPVGLDEAVRGGALRPRSFDLAFAFEVIEHVPRPREFVTDLLGLARPGGLVAITTPNFHLFRLVGPSAQVVAGWQEHLHFFEPDTLAALVRRCGGEEVEVETLACVPCGDRRRQKLAAGPLGPLLRRIASRNGIARALADRAFRAMNLRGDGADRARRSGLSILCLARVPS